MPWLFIAVWVVLSALIRVFQPHGGGGM